MNYLNIRSYISKSTIISSIGDFTSIYAYYLLFEKVSNDTMSSGHVLLSKSISAIITFFLFNKLIQIISYKTLIQTCQILLGIITFIITYSLFVKSLFSTTTLFIISIFQFSLFNIYNQSLSSYSKHVEGLFRENVQNIVKSNQAILELATRIGQIFGPLIFFSFLNIFKADLWIPFLFDGITFSVSAFLFKNLPDYKINYSVGNLFLNLAKTLKKKTIMSYFIARSFFILNVAFINIYIFYLIKSFGLSSVYVPLIDTFSAMGSSFLLFYLAKAHGTVKVPIIRSIIKLDHWNLIIFGGLFFSSCYIIVSSGLVSFYTSLIFFTLGGIGNAAQMTGYRTIINDSTSQREFNEIYGFSIIHARVIESSVIILFLSFSPLISSNYVFYTIIGTCFLSLISAITANWLGLVRNL